MKLTKNVPKAIKGKFVRHVIRRFLFLFAIYGVMYYSVIVRYGYSYFAQRISAVGTVIVYAAFVLIPLLAFRIPHLFVEHAYEGEVLSVKRARTTTIWAGGLGGAFDIYGNTRNKGQWCIAVTAKIRLDNGKVIKRLIRKYELDDYTSSLCQVGDRVRHFKGAKYTQIYGKGARHDVDCIWCGHYSPKKEQYCLKCGTLLYHWDEDTPYSETQRIANEPLREEEATVSVARAYTPTDDAVYNKPDMRYSHPKPVARGSAQDELEIGEVTPTPEFGTYKRKVDYMDVFTVFFQTMVTYLVTSFISMTFGSVESKAEQWLVYLPISFIVPMILTATFIRELPSQQYRASGRIPAWLLQGTLTVVPVEVLRTAASFIPYSRNVFGGFFAPVANLMWQHGYVEPYDRVEAVAQGLYIADDYVAFAICALATVVVRIVILIGVYYFFWRKHELSRKTMVND